MWTWEANDFDTVIHNIPALPINTEQSVNVRKIGFNALVFFRTAFFTHVRMICFLIMKCEELHRSIGHWWNSFTQLIFLWPLYSFLLASKCATHCAEKRPRQSRMLKKLCLIRQVCCPCTFLLANFSTLSGRKTTAFPTCIVPKLAITRIKRKAGTRIYTTPFRDVSIYCSLCWKWFFFNDRVAIRPSVTARRRRTIGFSRPGVICTGLK